MELRLGQYGVSDFLTWNRSKSLVLSPSFQRRPMWPQTSKALLLDTILRGYPTPPIILRQISKRNVLEPLKEVVDGQQRLRTLISYIEPSRLEDFDARRDDFVVKPSQNKSLAGKRFGELDQEVQRLLLEYQFSVQVLPPDVEDREVLRIFSRLNSTGLKLNPQELRNAEFIGLFKATMYDMAFRELNRWRDWKIFSEMDIARMHEVELTSDLVVCMYQGIRSKSQPAISALYREFDEEFKERAEVIRRFEHVMDTLDSLIGSEIPTSTFAKESWIYSLFAFIYDKAFGLRAGLTRREKPKPLPPRFRRALMISAERAEAVDASQELFKALRGATSDAGSRLARHRFLTSSYKRV